MNILWTFFHSAIPYTLNLIPKRYFSGITPYYVTSVSVFIKDDVYWQMIFKKVNVFFALSNSELIRITIKLSFQFSIFYFYFFGNWENLHCCCIISDDYLMRSKQKTNCKTTMFNGSETVSNVRKNSSRAKIIFSHHAKQHYAMLWLHCT